MNDWLNDPARHLRLWYNNEPAGNTLKLLIDFAAVAICQRHWGRLGWSARRQETSPRLLAKSLISGLFVKSGAESPLGRALENYLSEDNPTLVYRFITIARRTSAQELFHRWSEEDPQSARLWRNLFRTFKKPGIIGIPPAHPEWVGMIVDGNVNAGATHFTYDEILRLVMENRSARRSQGEDIIYVLKVIMDSEGRCRMVPVETLFQALREARARLIDEEYDRLVDPPEDPHFRLITERARARAVELVRQKLQEYRNKEKLSDEIVQAYLPAISDILNDYAIDGITLAYRTHLKDYLPGLTDEMYRNELSSTFEYLTALGRDTFFGDIRRQLE